MVNSMDNSEKLFEYAMKQLDTSNIPSNHWTIGGGTILKKFYQHRESKDIDVFLDNPQFLGMLSPRINDAVEYRLRDYSEASNYRVCKINCAFAHSLTSSAI